MSAENSGEPRVSRNPVWILLAVPLMFICAFCAGEWYLTGMTFVSLSMRADLANLAQHVLTRSEQFGIVALGTFLISAFVLGITDPRSRNSGASPLRKYLRGLVITVLGTMCFLVLDFVLFGWIFSRMNLQ